MIEDLGLDRLRSMVVRPLTGFRVAPFYGCYIVRPSSALGFDEHPERQDSLERVIEAVGAQVVDFPGKTLCCGFPILTINEANSVKMVANHTLDAKGLGARSHGDALPVVPPQPGWIPAQRGRRRSYSHRSSHTSSAANDWPGAGNRPQGHALEQAHRVHKVGALGASPNTIG